MFCSTSEAGVVEATRISFMVYETLFSSIKEKEKTSQDMPLCYAVMVLDLFTSALRYVVLGDIS